MPEDDVRAQSMIFQAAKLAAAYQYVELPGIGGPDREVGYARELSQFQGDATIATALVHTLFPGGVPSLESIARSKRRALDREIRDGSERGSVLMQMFKKVEMPHGQRFSSFRGGVLSEPTATQEHGFEMEIPRLEELDPEALALRRWRSLEIVSQLQDHPPSMP